MRAKTTPKIDPVDEMLVALGLDPSELRKI